MQSIPRDVILGQVTKRKDWTSNIFTIWVQADIGAYQAGQFTKLALANEQGEWTKRAYSMVSSHQASPGELEFLIITDENGSLTPRLNRLSEGDDIYVGTTVSGFMTVDEIPDYAKDLWLLSTGTAVGPFLSILREANRLERFRKIVLVHAVRYKDELVYHELTQQLIRQYAGKLMHVPIISREEQTSTLKGRIPHLLMHGEIQSEATLDLSPDYSWVYMCGNPAMVRDTAETLKALGLNKHLRRKPGQFSSENYW
ncbi:ferredoxin--NADP reductase [Vibrio sp. S4M6]|uniref:ferredoxin--NADP reductase n=1 Tax=Vibrio sinus TaxID=2946865 RepID=UPI00202A0F19|nr:ferredoxin--NADP reductase [Vibrio sinus]MCL9781260.1 ferredoxin--NADP reductase [Vibrio sinus]